MILEQKTTETHNVMLTRGALRSAEPKRGHSTE